MMGFYYLLVVEFYGSFYLFYVLEDIFRRDIVVWCLVIFKEFWDNNVFFIFLDFCVDFFKFFNRLVSVFSYSEGGFCYIWDLYWV